MTLQLDWLRGCATALVIPFNAKDELDEERFLHLVERQISSGVRLLVPCGSTGRPPL